MKFKFLVHTADIKFQAVGKTLNEAFENSAFAFANTMYEKKVKDKIKNKIKVEGKDLESLLYNFLEELLFLLDSENFFISSCKVKIKKFSKKNFSLSKSYDLKISDDKKGYLLEAELKGDDAKNYSISLDVKAITYNEMFVKRIKGRWVCQVVLDV